MTDENLAELRRGIEVLARAGVVASSVSASGLRYGYKDRMAADVFVYWPDTATLPDLTTAQQLALSVLLGDESVLPQALADYMIESGHEYATAVAEKARAEERERCLQLLTDARKYLNYRNSLVAEELRQAIEGGCDPNPKMFFMTAMRHGE